MVNQFYNPTGSPATRSQGLSAVQRREFAAISTAFDLMPQISTTGQFSTVFNQQGNYTFTLPSGPGTLAMLSDIAPVSAAVALSAPLNSPTLTGTPTTPTPPDLDHTLTIANTTWVANFLAASGFAPAGASPVVSVAARTGAVILTHNDITDWTSTLAPLAATGVQSLTNAGRNLFHNPILRIHQRGLGAWGTTGSYTADRWRMDFLNGTMSVAINSLTDAQRALIGDENADNCITVTVAGGAGANDFSILSQFIEGVPRISNKTITVSFWVFALSGTPKIGVGVRQSFGTGGSPSTNVDMSGQSVTLTTAPVRYSLTFTLPSMAGKIFGSNAGTDYTRIAFAFSSGTTNAAIFGTPGTQSATFVMWGMQCEISSTASPLDKPDSQMDWANCQRFYQSGALEILGSVSTAGFFVGNTIMLPVRMRQIPTVASNFPAPTNTPTATVAALSAGAMIASASASAPGTIIANGTFTASADF